MPKTVFTLARTFSRESISPKTNCRSSPVAFNTVSRANILAVLKGEVKLPTWVLEMMASYLSERTQYVQNENKTSDKRPCRTGVFAGAVLSPLFFTVVTDKLRLEHENCRIIKFAADTVVISEASSSQRLHDFFSGG